MQKKLLFGSMIVLALTSGLVIFYPQLFGCKSYHAYKQYRVYFCGKDTARVNIAAIDSVLDQTGLLLKKTQFSSVKQPFKLFFRSKHASYINWPFQFSKEAYAQTIPVFHNIFVWNSDFKTNNVYIPSGHHRPLASVLAHEIVHVLYENQYGWSKILINWLDKDEKSSYGFMWKEEGYAEYIAGGSGIGMKDGLKILNGHSNPYYHPIEAEYFIYWLTIKYLIDIKHFSIDQIVYEKMKFNTVLQQALTYFNQH